MEKVFFDWTTNVDFKSILDKEIIYTDTQIAAMELKRKINRRDRKKKKLHLKFIKRNK